jgi:hypothetical protein
VGGRVDGAVSGSRTVVFHAAGNSANGDESQFGDFIYTATQVARAQ